MAIRIKGIHLMLHKMYGIVYFLSAISRITERVWNSSTIGRKGREGQIDDTELSWDDLPNKGGNSNIITRLPNTQY